MTRDELDTPVPIVRLDIVEDNLARMQAYCDRHGLRLRPHIKTHKVIALAKRQMELGAVGITCQKLGEAEVMADAGVDDILLSYPLIGKIKAQRLAALARRIKLTVAVDSENGISTIAEAARLARAPIDVLVEFESGGERTGVQTPAEAVAMAKAIRLVELLRFKGLMTYPISPKTAPFVRETRTLLEREGIELEIVSGGGTPGAYSAHAVENLTELRVGTYIYNDRTIVGLTSEPQESCALRVLATVVSRPTEDRAIIDAGSKTLSSDLVPATVGSGYGLIEEYPCATIVRLNEEHGIVDLSRSERKPKIGERLTIVPNHVCVVSNLHDEIYVTENGAEFTPWSVAARGATT